MLPEGIGHAVDEIILLGIAGKICQGKHRERPDRTRKSTIPEYIAYAREVHSDDGQEDNHHDHSRRQNPTPRHYRFLIRGSSSLRRWSDVFRGLAERSDEAIAAASESLDITGRVGGIAQSRPKSLHGGVQTMLEIDVGVGGPESPLQLFACHHLARLQQKHRQHFNRLALQLHTQSMFA